MTYTLNGCGTRLCGGRALTKEEIDSWGEYFPFDHQTRMQDYRLVTESFCLLWIPIIPLKTYVVRFMSDDKYQIVYYPFGTDGGVSWGHVKKSPSFYVAPILIILYILYVLFSPLFPKY
jgi:hypothetical protein